MFNQGTRNRLQGSNAFDQAVYADEHGFVRAADAAGHERLTFLRRTYAWFLAGVLGAIAVALATYQIALPSVNDLLRHNGFLWVIGGFMVAQFLLARLIARRETAAIGLFGSAIAEGILFGTLAVVLTPFLGREHTFTLFAQGLTLTGLIFGGLTAYVFLTKQDFSWLYGAMSMLAMVLLGVCVMQFFWPIPLHSGLGLGIIVLGIVVATGFVVIDTSLIMRKFGPGDEIIGAAHLLGDFGLLLYYVVMFLMRSNDV